MNVELAGFLSTAAGLVLPPLITWLKGAKWFTWVQVDQSGRIQALAAVLSALSAFLTAWKSGALDQGTAMALGTTVLAFVHTLGVSTWVHHWWLKKSELSSPAAPIAPGQS